MWETIEASRGGGQHGAAHHPVPRRGRPARRPDRGHRPRQGDRRGHQRRAQGPDRRRPARHHARGPRRRRRGDRRARRDVPRPRDRRGPRRLRAGAAAARRHPGGHPQARLGRRRGRRHRAPPADARRRVHRPHRPRRPRTRRGRPRRRRRPRPHERLDHDRGHDGPREAQPAADPAPARPADRLHGAAGHVRAAVRLRVRRRDPDAGLRLRRLPDAGHHRPVDRVRRLRDRARPVGGRQEGPDRPLPLAADVARGGAQRAYARRTSC